MSNYHIIDRRKNPAGKNMPNRKRFIDKAKQKIKEKLKENLSKREITSDEDEQININIDGIDEPSFGYDSDSGEWDYVLPGNKDYMPGDKLPKPQGGSGGGKGSKKAGTGEGEDEFVFSVSKEEYLNIIFEDLELPDLIKQSAKAAVAFERRRAGYSKSGPASNLDYSRTMRNGLGRRIALAFPLDRKIRALEEELQSATYERTIEIDEELKLLRIRRATVAYIDPIDVRYKRHEKFPLPNSQAVMFCIMDVSGSMGEREKEIAKRFFLLLYLFLERKYKKVNVVFICHTETAKEVDEQTFFYSQESGGTKVSSSLELMQQIVKERYDPAQWNLYCVQATDGDNIGDDNNDVIAYMKKLLPLFQYYVYNEIGRSDGHTQYYSDTLAKAFEDANMKDENFEIILLCEVEEVVPTFRKVFAKNAKK